jgi:hypothetical protein
MEKVSKIVGAHVTLHDLRRTFTTVAISECGVDFYKPELLTNHVPRGSPLATIWKRRGFSTSIPRLSAWVIGSSGRRSSLPARTSSVWSPKCRP